MAPQLLHQENSIPILLQHSHRELQVIWYHIHDIELDLTSKTIALWSFLRFTVLEDGYSVLDLDRECWIEWVHELAAVYAHEGDERAGILVEQIQNTSNISDSFPGHLLLPQFCFSILASVSYNSISVIP